MPLARYGVLAGRVVHRRSEGGTDTPHYQVRSGGGVDFRVAVNVLSQQQPSELLYLADEAFRHPLPETSAAVSGSRGTPFPALNPGSRITPSASSPRW